MGAIALSFILICCQSTSHRMPASTSATPEIESFVSNLYRLKLEDQLLQESVANAQKVLQKEGNTEPPINSEPSMEIKKYAALLKKHQKNLKNIESQYDKAQAFFDKTAEVSPLSMAAFDSVSWRNQKQVLLLNDPHSKSWVFNMDRNHAQSYEIEIQSRLISSQDPYEERKKETLSGTVSCDGPFEIRSLIKTYKYRANKKATLKIYDSKYDGNRIILRPASQVKECILQVKDSHSQLSQKVVLRSNIQPYQHLHDLIEACILPQTHQLNSLQKIFLTDQYNSMTCPQPVSQIVSLTEAIDSLKSKAELLLGQPLKDFVINNRDPYVTLDFSKAPYFDSIYVSYLVFRADFFGTLMARLLDYHAQRGTKVKIMVAGVIALEKDEKLLRALTRKNPNIELQEFKYQVPKGGDLLQHFDSIHRSMHVKMFLTLSKREPSLNAVFIGGRNIHDGFIFNQAYDYPYPDMVNYVRGDESFVHWRDFEFKISDVSFVEKTAAHFLTVWDRDAVTMQFRSLNVNIPLRKEISPDYFNQSTPLIRHYVSVPFKDEGALLKLYVQMLDSAQKSIMISTPYFRPPDPIVEAIERAAARGVDITVLTRLDLKGDTIDWLLSESNKPTVNKLLGRLRIFEYTEPKVILHSKIVLIDGVFSFLGSVNFNKRSFIHDTENGVMIYSPSYNKEMTQIYNQYLQDSRLIDEKLSRNYFKALLLKIFDTQF